MEVVVWGDNQFGQLGIGNTQVQVSPYVCSFNILISNISCGESHSAFVTNAGHVYCMGSNTDGQLGIEGVMMSTYPQLLETLLTFKAQGVACGDSHTVMNTTEGELFVWGEGKFGALGTGNFKSQPCPIQVNLYEKVRQISAGSRHSAVLLEDGSVKVTQNASFVDSGVQEPSKQIACGEFHTLILSKNGNVFIGNQIIKELKSIEKIDCKLQNAAINNRGELFLWTNSEPVKASVGFKVKDVALSRHFQVLIDENYHVWKRQNGQNPVLMSSLTDKNVIKAACGEDFCICLCNENEIELLRQEHREIRQMLEQYKNISRQVLGELSDTRLEKKINNALANYENLDQRNTEQYTKINRIEKEVSGQKIKSIGIQSILEETKALLQEKNKENYKLREMIKQETTAKETISQEMNTLKQQFEELKERSKIECSRMQDSVWELEAQLVGQRELNNTLENELDITKYNLEILKQQYQNDLVKINKEQRQDNQKLHQDNQQLAKDLNEQIAIAYKFSSNLNDLRESHEHLRTENKHLNKEMENLEKKNFDLYDKYCREISQRAKQLRHRSKSTII